MISVSEPVSQSDQIQSLLRELSDETTDLPVKQKERIEATLQKIQSCVSMLASNDGKVTLAAGEAKYRELAEIITDPFTVWDGNQKMVYRNKASAEMSQVPDAQALGKTFSEIYPSLAGSKVHEVYIRALETHQPQRIRSHWVRPSDGMDFYYDVSIYPTSTGLCVFSRNVTDQVRAEMAQREALERSAWLARFPDENPNPVARVSADGKILYCNRVSADPSGWGFQVGEQVPGSFLSFIKETNRQGKQIERDLQVGQTIYSIVFMPFPSDQYVNLYGRDINERKRAEAEIRESEARFRALSSVSSQVLYRMSPDWSEMRQLEGGGFLANTEKPNRNWMAEYIHPDDQEWVGAVIENAVRSGTVFDLEHRVLRTDGTLGWTASRAVPVRNDYGEIIEWFGAASDITERKRAEAALEKAYHDLTNERNRLLAVMAALPVGLVIVDSQGGVLHANREYEAIWGGPPPVTQSVADYVAYQAWWVDTGLPLKPEEWASAQAVQKGETVTGQFLQIQRFDGRRAFVLNSSAPILDMNGEMVGSTVAIMDITQLIEAQNALRESQNRFRVAVSTAPIMVYTCDRELRYTWIYNLLRGFRSEDVLGKRDDEVLSTKAAAELIAAKQLALETGQGRLQEVKVPLNGEDTYYILTTDPIRDQQGNVTGLTCSAIDITEQKRLQNEKQEQAIQIEVQRRLMGQREQDRHAIARDLHDGPIQMLSSTMFQLHMIKEVFPDPALEKELNQFGEDIKGTIQQLRDLLNELRPPALIHFGFSKVVRMFIEDFRERFPGIEVELELVENDTFLSNDTHLTLFRIFQAGVNNIIHHSDASKVWVVFKIDQDCFLLEIRDNGKGFELPEDLSQLTRHAHYGLVGMKERAEALNAEFTVSSAPGKGTRIIVNGPCSGKNLR